MIEMIGAPRGRLVPDVSSLTDVFDRNSEGCALKAEISGVRLSKAFVFKMKLEGCAVRESGSFVLENRRRRGNRPGIL
jgi:hypothetical protein